jgi:hypothetical protein
MDAADASAVKATFEEEEQFVSAYSFSTAQPL